MMNSLGDYIYYPSYLGDWFIIQERGNPFLNQPVFCESKWLMEGFIFPQKMMGLAAYVHRWVLSFRMGDGILQLWQFTFFSGKGCSKTMGILGGSPPFSEPKSKGFQASDRVFLTPRSTEFGAVW